MTALRKIQALAYRIERLGHYASDPRQRHVTKTKGILEMRSHRGVVFMLLCEPRTGRVWLRESEKAFEHGDEGIDQPDLSPQEAINWLIRYEGTILSQARVKARGEVIAELVDRRIRRITRAKSRGFKKDKPNKKRSEG